jgi:hypothetical protein
MIKDLTSHIWPRLQSIAAAKDLRRVTRVDMIVGSRYGPADALAAEFLGLFAGSTFAEARIEIVTVRSGQKYRLPGGDEELSASGWEIQITLLEGDE